MKNEKTTLLKLAQNVNKELSCTPDWYGLLNRLDINEDLYLEEDDRLKCYFIKRWYCTDSYVGVRAYFLDDELIAFSSQVGRKADESFEFISKDSTKKLREYIYSLIIKRDFEYDSLPYIEDLEAEIDSMFKIQYNGQILHKYGFLNGEKVEIVKQHYEFSDPRYFHTVEVKKENGVKMEVDCRDLLFEYNK